MKNFSILLVAFLFLQITTFAQWVQTSGPEGGVINCFVNFDTNLFAGTWGGGVFRSTNNGTTWTPVNNGLWNGSSVSSLAVIGTNLFAGISGSFGAVLSSTNNGTSWTPTDLTNTDVRALASSGTNLFAGTNLGVFHSTNNGTNWSAVNTGLTNPNVSSLIFSGTNLFAGTTGGVFLSTNSGLNWTAIGLTNQQVGALAVSDTNLFAGTTGGGVFRSSNNDTTWIPVNGGLLDSAIVSCLTVSDTNLFAGVYSGFTTDVYLSTNNGLNWSPTGLTNTNTLIGALYVNGSSLFAGTWRGVFRSTNYGANWTEVNSGMKSTHVFCLASSGTNLFAAIQNDVSLSSNGGDTWVSILKTPGRIFSVIVSSTYLFAGGTGHVWWSMNNGTSWDYIALTPYEISSFAINGTCLFVGTRGDGVWCTPDNGFTWTHSGNVGLTDTVVYSLTVRGTDLFAGTAGGVFLSTDNGLNWTAKGLTNLVVRSLAVSDTNLFAGTWGGGVFRSTNNGANWDSVSTGLTFPIVLSLAVIDTNLFAGTGGGGVFISTNNGENWTDFNTGLMPPNVQSIANVQALATDGTSLYAGNRGTGVWMRPLSEVPVELTSFTAIIYGDNIHLNWTTATETNNSGFEIQRKQDNSIWDRIGFVEGHGTTTEPKEYSYVDDINGINATSFAYRLKQIDYDGSFEYSDEVLVANPAPIDYALRQNYPNPFNPVTNISYSLPLKSQVELVVYNVLGEIVMQLVNEEKEAGNYSVEFNLTSLPSGIYFYRLQAVPTGRQAGSFVETKKMVFLR